jgi:hypothetical protein
MSWRRHHDLLSMATKNVGALALMMPSALRIARNTGVSPGRLLMPMSFGSLVGGWPCWSAPRPTSSSPKCARRPWASRSRCSTSCRSAGAWRCMAIVYLAFAYRLLPKGSHGGHRHRRGPGGQRLCHRGRGPRGLELRAVAGRRSAKFGGKGGGRGGAAARPQAIASPHPNRKILPGDVLLLEGQQQALNELIVKAKLKLTDADRPVVMDEPTDEVGWSRR